MNFAVARRKKAVPLPKFTNRFDAKGVIRGSGGCIWETHQRHRTDPSHAIEEFCATGTDRPPDRPASRIFLSCYWVMTVTVAAVFAGNLMALMAVKKHLPPINSLEDLAENDEFQAGLKAGGATEAFFRVGCSLLRERCPSSRVGGLRRALTPVSHYHKELCP